jgi:hypothetical protein
MKRIIAALVLSLAASVALAGNNGPGTDTCRGSTCNPGDSGGSVTAIATGGKAEASAVGVGVGVGGEGGKATAAANPTAEAAANGAPVNVKTFALGGTGLAASANACQGSFSVGPVGKTYDVSFCKYLEIVRGMQSTGFSVESQRAIMCKIEDLADAAECRKAD